MNAALLDKLLKAGTPTELVAEVASELARAEATQDLIEKRRAKDRERKRVPRNSTETEESAETLGKGSLEVSPPAPPLPNPSKSTPYIPPKSEAENEETLKPEHVIEAWNDLAARHGLPVVKKMTPERRRKLNTFIARHTIDDITEAIAAIPRSPFLLGQNGRGWRASFDWFLEPRNLTKLTEQTYVH